MLKLLNLGARGGTASRLELARTFADALRHARPLHVELAVTHAVEIADLTARIDAAHRLGAPRITFAAPLDYSELDVAVAHAARRALVVVRTTTPPGRRVARTLARAGLHVLELDLGSAAPRYTSRLVELHRAALFELVLVGKLGACHAHDLAALADTYGFGLRLDLPDGPTSPGDRALYERTRSSRPDHAYASRLLDGDRPVWTCRGGARYLLVDECGEVHPCASRRGSIGIALVDYAADDIARNSGGHGCEAGCGELENVRASMFDDHPVATLLGVVHLRVLRR